MSAVIKPVHCDAHDVDLAADNLMSGGYWCVPGQHSIPAIPTLTPGAARLGLRVVKLRRPGFCAGTNYRRDMHSLKAGEYVVRDRARDICPSHARDDSLVAEIGPVGDTQDHHSAVQKVRER